MSALFKNAMMLLETQGSKFRYLTGMHRFNSGLLQIREHIIRPETLLCFFVGRRKKKGMEKRKWANDGEMMGKDKASGIEIPKKDLTKKGSSFIFKLKKYSFIL